MCNLECKINGWQVWPREDDQMAADVRLDIWISGGTRCGRIAGTVKEGPGDRPPYVDRLERDDFELPVELRDGLLIEAYVLIGRMPSDVDGCSTETFSFEPWLTRRWPKDRVRSLAETIEAVIRRNVPEPEASGARC